MNEIEQKEIEEMARDFTKFEITTKCGIGVLAERFYNAGYRNCKDKVVLTEREHEIAMKNQYDVGFRFGCKKMQEENGQLRLENNDLEAENDKLKEELRQASELKKEYQNDFCNQFNKGYKKGNEETIREIIDKVDDMIGGKMIAQALREIYLEVE